MTPEVACRFVQTSRQEKDGTWSELTWFETIVLYCYCDYTSCCTSTWYNWIYIKLFI